MTIKDLFVKLTKSTMPGGNEHLAEKYLPGGFKKDFHGNYYIKIGDPTVMFTSHLDTADTGSPKEVTHVFQGDIIKTDGKTILGADDKAGTAVMIYMINKGVTGLYYFFLNEERGCVGSRALNNYLDKNKDDELYKKITKVISLDRKDDDSVITHQLGERCCSDEFADELAKRLNTAGGFKYKKDPTGSVTDSHQIATKFSECTNLSVGYDAQHTHRESQNIVFLQKLADACCKIDWETLPVKRDYTKVEHRSYGSYNYGRRYYDDTNSNWWENNNYRTSSSTSRKNGTTTGPSNLPVGTEYVIDYLGNEIKVADAQWCEYDKAWCEKSEAIWVDYVGFYTTPDYDETKVKKKEVNTIKKFKELTENDIKVGLDLYKDNELFGSIIDVGDRITLLSKNNSKFILPLNKILTYGYQIQSSKKLKENDVKIGLEVFHPSFGEGKITGIRPDKLIIKVMFKNKGEKDIRVDVANMTF